MVINGKEYGFFLGFTALEDLQEAFSTETHEATMDDVQNKIQALQPKHLFVFVKAMLHSWCVVNDQDMPDDQHIRKELEVNLVGVMQEIRRVKGLSVEEVPETTNGTKKKIGGGRRPGRPAKR